MEDDAQLIVNSDNLKACVSASVAPSEENCFLSAQVAMMARSLLRITGLRLLSECAPELSDSEFAQSVFEAKFALVSHDTNSDPIFNYANRTALKLFEMTWEEFTALPSRLSAEPVHRDERARLMAQVREKGFISNYGGVRISKSGKRFCIHEATVFNLEDERGIPCGQAALFSNWTEL